MHHAWGLPVDFKVLQIGDLFRVTYYLTVSTIERLSFRILSSIDRDCQIDRAHMSEAGEEYESG
jgi:hypothetical protein